MHLAAEVARQHAGGMLFAPAAAWAPRQRRSGAPRSCGRCARRAARAHAPQSTQPRFRAWAGARQGARRTAVSAARARLHAAGARCAAPWLLAELRERRQRHRVRARSSERREPRSCGRLCQQHSAAPDASSLDTAAAAPAAPQRHAPREEGVGCASERDSSAPSRPRRRCKAAKPAAHDVQAEEPAVRQHAERRRPASERGSVRK